ncbi:Ion channel, partial [Halocaridina rubra]
AWAFVEIERPFEERLYAIKKREAVKVTQTMNWVANNFWYQADKKFNWTFNAFNASVYKDLKKLESYIIHYVGEYGYDGTVEGWSYAWTFSNALLLTMTIVSTIGYGHISPVTFWGKLFCIIYAIIGCPLFLVFLGNLGGSMAETFIYIYSRWCCRSCRSRRNLEELPPNASKKQRKLLIDDDIGQEDYMPTSKLQVPITINIVVLFVYIMIGAVLFSFWESWDLSSSTYFTFVTLSTIGFGDMVPGTAVLDRNNPLAGFKMFVCVCYIMLGMALVSMCINLMQEQIMHKCRWLAQELGLNEKTDVKEKKPDNPDADKPLSAIDGNPNTFKKPKSPPSEVLPGTITNI